MFLNLRKEACGRYASKPEDKPVNDDVELFEEAEPIQQKVENLRTKIALQERYNAALKDSVEETSAGSFVILREMFDEIFNLRISLREAVSREKRAVNNALRTHRYFQLALKKCSPLQSIQWMDDKLFDNTKVLNNHIDRLINKRKKLESTESAVEVLEKWPIPGSLPWEIKIGDKLKAINVDQSNTMMKLECAKMLNVRYKNIRGRLRHERNMYTPVLRNLNFQLSFQLSELKKLEQMLGNAKKFQNNAEKMLEYTEAQASVSRKLRRSQMSRMRREMQRLVQQEQLSLLGSKPAQQRRASETRKESPAGADDNNKLRPDFILHTQGSFGTMDNDEQNLNYRLAQKRAIIDTFNDNAAMLVDVMKIPNLTHIPTRLETVINLAAILKEEKKSKEQLKSHLIKQRDQLMQLFCVIRYTGTDHVTQNDLVIQDYQKSLAELEKESAFMQESLNQDSRLLMDIQTGVECLIQRIDGLDRKSQYIKDSTHLMKMLPVFYGKLENLTQSLAQLKREVPASRFATHVAQSSRRPTAHKFAALNQQIPARYIRVGDIIEFDEVSDEEEFEDFKVPGRVELKMKSQKIVEQGLLRLGIADGGAKKRRSRQKSVGSRPGSFLQG